MRIVCISDTHNCNEQISVPDGDLLIHSGDATVNGTEAEIAAFADWFIRLPHERKFFVAGNHDWLFERDNARAGAMIADASVTYLQDSAIEIGGLKIYGSPWQPRFYDWAFNLDRGEQMAAKWRMIPDEVDILITHGPPNGILDAVPRAWGTDHAGCEELRKKTDELTALGRLKLHIFGHIHCGYGTVVQNDVRFVNASICDEQYLPTQAPIVVDIQAGHPV